ncbi:hypothetical protein FAM18121_02541 [Lacticaseibacillus paracasei]|nr:hypothetical protein [Lacticaseibacillus paracasei]RND52034.1 hypothetical protein FAM18121_02541 [Lacticaseibacillus paracasei]
MVYRHSPLQLSFESFGIDAAIVLSNVLTLLRVFAIPILILAKFEGEAYQIRYKFTTRVEDMVA